MAKTDTKSRFLTFIIMVVLALWVGLIVVFIKGPPAGLVEGLGPGPGPRNRRSPGPFALGRRPRRGQPQPHPQTKKDQAVISHRITVSSITRYDSVKFTASGSTNHCEKTPFKSPTIMIPAHSGSMSCRKKPFF